MTLHEHDFSVDPELSPRPDGTVAASVWCLCGASTITSDPATVKAAWDHRYGWTRHGDPEAAASVKIDL